MKLRSVSIRNFRRLENITIPFEETETIFVGPNNSGKTSATTAFRLFLTKQSFQIHDFSVSRITELDRSGELDTEEDKDIPKIEMDFWFSINQDIEFGRVFSLLPSLSSDFETVGIRLKFGVKDWKKLKAEYLERFPRLGNEKKSEKNLSHFLASNNNLSRHFEIRYFALQEEKNAINESFLEPDEGKRVLRQLIRVDFVDAQRNIDDQDTPRSNRLSSAFAGYYKKNLEQATVSEEANKILDANNIELTNHYEKHFKKLIGVIQKLGVPSVNDRHLKIISSLDPEQVLRGNTDLLYVDPTTQHHLPEAYNGLGFKNLVYMAIQVSHFHLQWIDTTESRPLCQIIFIEEPEVHLHAQVQQTFISNIWQIIKNSSEDAREQEMIPQLVVTTHSSHILDAIEFSQARYFQRCPLADEESSQATVLNGSKVHSLGDFKAEIKNDVTENSEMDDNLTFLKKFLKLTHCDLFFADAAILIEGTVEKLLLPQMIEKSAKKLKHNYLTILEVGGAYASRFAGLLQFLGIPYLVITDIDSVDPNDNRKACRADKEEATTSNSSLSYYFDKTKVSELVNLEKNKHVFEERNCCVVFQKPTPITIFPTECTMHGRTLEEAFIYKNIELFQNGKIRLGSAISLSSQLEADDLYNTIYEHVKSPSFKKTEFALDISSSSADWQPPDYITDGLKWLEERLSPHKEKELKVKNE